MSPATPQELRALQAQRLAVAFCVLLRTRLTDDQVRLIQAGDADPDDFCDSNMVLDAAFNDVFKRPVCMPSDWEAGRCTEAEHDHDLALWNEAVQIAQGRNYSLDGADLSAGATVLADVSLAVPPDTGERLDAAAQTADLLLSDLLQAHKRATALQSLVLLPLIAEARKVHDSLRALIAASREQAS